MDGKIIIGVDLETKKLNEKLQKLQKKLEVEEKKLDLKFGDLEYAREELRKTAQELDKIKKKRDEINQKIQSRQKQYSEYLAMDQSDPEIRARTGFLAGDIEKLKIKQQEVNTEFNQYNQKLNEANDNLTKAEISYDNQKNRITEINGEIDQTKQKLQNVPMENLKKGFESVEKSIKKVTNSIGRWALALFGIRTAYNFVRSAMSTIASQDDQLNADIQYMKNALVYAIEPIVRWIVDLAKQLMFYVQAIVKALTGKDIFANADKSLENSNKNAKKLNKELSKTLATFDEMNVLQDNSSSGSGSEDTLPSFRFSDEEMKLPKWMQWILDHKDELIGAIAGIAGALAAIKLGISPWKALGIGILITGIIWLVQDLIDVLKDPTFENFMNIFRDIGLILIGLGIIIGSPVVGLIGAFVLLEAEYGKNEKKFKESFDRILNYLDTTVKPEMEEKYGILGGAFTDVLEGLTRSIQTFIDSNFGTISHVVHGIQRIFKGDVVGGLTEIMKGLSGPLLAPFNALSTFVKFLWDKWIKKPMETLQKKFKGVFDEIGKFMASPIDSFVEGITGLWDRIKEPVEEVGRKIGEKLDVNKIASNLRTGLSGIGGGLRSLFGFRKGGIIYPPKLAVGGVINQPGRGVPLTSAIGGEHGAEGVIPLTDSQQMQLLGEAIGKFITINASITNTMNGRVISRELQKVQNDSDFAFNR